MVIFRVIGGFFTGIFGFIGVIWGVISLILSIIFLLPLLGWVNWLIIPFTILGMIFSGIATANPDTKGLGNAGIVLGSIALVLSVLRLILGGGFV